MSLGTFTMPNTGTLVPAETAPRKLHLIEKSKWQTPFHHRLTFNSSAMKNLHTLNISLIPGPDALEPLPAENVLHVHGSVAYLQHADGITWPKHINIDHPNETHYAIRCTVVSEKVTDTAPILVMILDRILQIDGRPYLLMDHMQHASYLRELCGRIRIQQEGIHTNVAWRGFSSVTAELWRMACETTPHTCTGIRFEIPGAPSSATDTVWFARDTACLPLALVDDLANQRATFDPTTNEFHVHPACQTFAMLDKLAATTRLERTECATAVGSQFGVVAATAPLAFHATIDAMKQAYAAI